MPTTDGFSLLDRAVSNYLKGLKDCSIFGFQRRMGLQVVTELMSRRGSKRQMLPC